MRGRVRSLSLAGGLMAAACVTGLPAAAPVFSPGRGLLRIDDRLADRSSVALTFDDGPHPRGTPAALDALEQHGVKATFFLVGEQVERRPSLVGEILSRGHEIAIHSHTHRVATWLTPRAFKDELDRAADAIGEAAGFVPDLYRPPRGVFTYSGLSEVRRRGWHPVLWAADGRDWRGTATAASVSARIARRLRGGEVVLLHDSDFYSSPGSWINAVAAVPLLLAAIQARQFGTATLTRHALAG